jgi:hypothetical protein
LKEKRNPFLWQPLIAIAAVLVILLSLGYFFNPADINTGLIASAEAQPVHIHGECICMHCTLKQTDRCAKALRYTDNEGNVKIIRIARDPKFRAFNKCFCGGPTPALIEGTLGEENGQEILIADSVTLEEENIL